MLYPIRVARVSRFDRQLRYYSEGLKLASAVSMYSTQAHSAEVGPEKRGKRMGAGRIYLKTRKTLLQPEQRFGPALATGLPNLTAGGFPPHLLQDFRPVFPF